jgi:hypothetical protein
VHKRVAEAAVAENGGDADDDRGDQDDERQNDDHDVLPIQAPTRGQEKRRHRA